MGWDGMGAGAGAGETGNGEEAQELKPPKKKREARGLQWDGSLGLLQRCRHPVHVYHVTVHSPWQRGCRIYIPRLHITYNHH